MAVKRQTVYYYDLISELLKKEIKVRYKSSILGYAWSILSPLAQSVVFYFAFKHVLRIQIDNYALFLILGLFPWQWFLNSTITNATSILGNSNLIKKTVFPREYIILAGVLNDLVHFLLSLPVIFMFLIIYHQTPRLDFPLMLLLLVGIQFIFVLGVSFLISAINVFFRDMERLITILLNMLFYATPVIYAVSMIPEGLRGVVLFNPMSMLIVSYRDTFLNNPINWGYIGLASLESVAILLIGWTVFSNLKKRFAEVL